MRGPGRKKRDVDAPNQRLCLQPPQLQGGGRLANDENSASSHHDSSVATSENPYQVNLNLSEEIMGLEALLQKRFPVFLHPDINVSALEELKWAVREEQKSPEGFVPLISLDQIRHLFEVTYDETMATYPLFDLMTLNRFNAEQHAVSSTHPAGNPARWAIINTWIAMGVRSKTAPGLEGELNCVTKAYYRNAVLVLPDLILQPASKEAIQALLLMAVYAEGSLDHRSYVMLVTNAVRQIELLIPRLSEVSDLCEIESCQPSLSFARLQDMKVASKYGMTLLLGSLVI